MRSIIRRLLRFTALVAVAAVLFGVPIAVVRTVGRPLPTLEQWRAVWRSHQVETGFVVRLGSMVFVALWAWFACTALAEAWRVARRGPAVPSPLEGKSPKARIQRLVRFIAISSVAVSGGVGIVVVGGGVGGGMGGGGMVARRPPASEITVPAASTRPSTAPVMAELAGASLLCAGAVVALRHRRSRALRSAPVGARPVPVSVEQARTEIVLRSTTAAERIARLDFALRSIAAQLRAAGTEVMATRVDAEGAIWVHLTGLASPPPRWNSEDMGSTWWLPASVDTSELVRAAHGEPSPSPLLVTLGAHGDGGECFVDVGVVGVLEIDSPAASSILRTVAATIALSPFMEWGEVITVGIGEVPVADRPVEPAPSIVDALERAASSVGPVVVVSDEPRSGGGDEGNARDADCAAGSVRGLVVRAGGPPAPCSLRCTADGVHWVEPFGWSVVPAGLPVPVLDSVRDLVDRADAPFERFAPVLAFDGADRHASFVEPEWSLLVRVLGRVEVVSADGIVVRFEKSKALELVAWLAMHRERPTRGQRACRAVGQRCARRDVLERGQRRPPGDGEGDSASGG